MNQSKLLDVMRFYGVSKPMRGSGNNGRIVNVDLEDTLGDHFFAKKFPNDSEDKRHMQLRRTIRPMKSYRFTNLSPAQQADVMKDDNGWIGELKRNGWRIIVTHIPGDPLHFFGGNLSTTEFLPVDYTYHLPVMRISHPTPLMLDCEAVCFDTVIQQDGYPSTDTREAVAAILGCGAETAIHLQQDVRVDFKCFDSIPNKPMTLSARKKILSTIDFSTTNITIEKHYAANKKKVLTRFWKAQEEGMILKNVSSDYDSGGRKRTHSIKIKKSAASLFGDTIDTFVSGFVLTDVWSYKDLIGGLELSVYIEDEPHVIATITNLTDHMRYSLTEIVKGLPVLVEDAYDKVLEIDGQELSTRNRLLMHAVLVTGEFRTDKNASECTMEWSDFGSKF